MSSGAIERQSKVQLLRETALLFKMMQDFVVYHLVESRSPLSNQLESIRSAMEAIFNPQDNLQGVLGNRETDEMTKTIILGAQNAVKPNIADFKTKELLIARDFKEKFGDDGKMKVEMVMQNFGACMYMILNLHASEHSAELMQRIVTRNVTGTETPLYEHIADTAMAVMELKDTRPEKAAEALLALAELTQNKLVPALKQAGINIDEITGFRKPKVPEVG